MPKRPDTFCQECAKKLNGRRDKKFCDVSCRNAFNNNQSLYPEKRAANVHKSQLTDRGFRFDYYTSTYTTKQGNTYFFNYEFGFMELEDDRMVIVENIEEKIKNPA